MRKRKGMAVFEGALIAALYVIVSYLLIVDAGVPTGIADKLGPPPPVVEWPCCPNCGTMVYPEAVQ